MAPVKVDERVDAALIRVEAKIQRRAGKNHERQLKLERNYEDMERKLTKGKDGKN